MHEARLDAYMHIAYAFTFLIELRFIKFSLLSRIYHAKFSSRENHFSVPMHTHAHSLIMRRSCNKIDG